MPLDLQRIPEPALLESVIASAMDAIVAVDADQRIVLFNPAAEAMFRCAAGDAIGSALDRFIPERFRLAHQLDAAEFMSTGATFRAMGRLRSLAAQRADGEEFPIEATISHSRIGGRTYGAVIVRDVGARLALEVERTATAAAVAERDRLRDIVAGMPGGVQVLAAPHARLEFANNEFVSLVFGPAHHAGALPEYGRDYAFQRADGTPLEEGERPGLRALRGERVHNQQLQMHRNGAGPLPVAAHAAPLRAASGAITHAIVMIQDVTKAQQAEQLKDDFLALISHELRTPLTAIHGGAHLIANDTGALDDETRREILADIVAESDRLDRMLGNLLALTNLLAGRLRPTTEPVLVGPLARGVSVEIGRQSDRHEFVVDVPIDVPPIEADPGLLEEVLRNLYENALKYSPDGGQIRITADRGGPGIAIHVTDDGIGIGPEHVGAVFERFRRVGGDPTVRGMGLGLYLSRMLVEAQGGRIWADSPGVGFGTTISVSFPIAEKWEAG